MCARATRLLFILMLGGVVVSWATPPFSVISQTQAVTDEDRMLLGTWQFNPAKSRYKIGTPPQSQIRIYEPHGQGVKATIKTTFVDGRSATVEYTANYDSLEYAVRGASDVDTIALKKVGRRTAEATLSHAGRVMATARRIISEDGQSMTIEYQGTLMGQQVDYVAVYDKQK
jgi:hypothetical protein